MIFCSHFHPEIEFNAGTLNPEAFELSSGKTININISNIIMQSKNTKIDCIMVDIQIVGL